MKWIWKVFVFITIRLKGEVNSLTREFLEVFYFPRDFIVAIESFQKEIFEKFQLYLSAYNHLEYAPISLYIFYGWQ